MTNQQIYIAVLPAINFCRQIAGKAHVYAHMIFTALSIRARNVSFKENHGHTSLSDILNRFPKLQNLIKMPEIFMHRQGNTKLPIYYVVPS